MVMVMVVMVYRAILLITLLKRSPSAHLCSLESRTYRVSSPYQKSRENGVEKGERGRERDRALDPDVSNDQKKKANWKSPVLFRRLHREKKEVSS